MTKITERFGHLDLLRAVSIFLVLVAHAGLGDVVPGGSGVTIFFCISGFVITHLVLKERNDTGEFDIVGFYVRRALKIVPPLILIILLPTVIFSFVIKVDWSHVMGEVFFFFNWIYMTGNSQILPGSGVVWSLSIEEQFYILFALLWLLLVRKQRGEIYLAWVALALVAYSNCARIIFANGDSAHARVYYGSDTRMDGIALGILAAIWLSRAGDQRGSLKKPSVTWDFVAIAAVGVFVLSLLIRDEWFRNTFRFTLQSGATIVFIIFGFRSHNTLLSKVFRRMSQVKWLKLVGLASYSIYLCHLMLFDAMNPITDQMPLGLAVVLKLISGLALGIGCYYLIEVPALKFKSRLMLRRKNQRH